MEQSSYDHAELLIMQEKEMTLCALPYAGNFQSNIQNFYEDDAYGR